MEKVKTIFCGSGNFAVPIITGLIASDILDIVAVITQPDKPVGRKKVLTPPPVKREVSIMKPDLQILQPTKLREDAAQIMEDFAPDLIIVADYGQIVPDIMLDQPKFRALNIHGSILPDLRGAVPIPIAILRGYEKTGISIPIMTPGLDDGPVLVIAETNIASTDTTESLTLKLSQLGITKLLEILPAWFSGELKPVEQNENNATVVGKKDFTKDKAKFDSNIKVTELDRMIRAFYPWPIAWTEVTFNNKQIPLKIYKSKFSDIREGEPGDIIRHGKKLILNVADGSLELLELQIAGKTIGTSSDYLFLAGQAKLV